MDKMEISEKAKEIHESATIAHAYGSPRKLSKVGLGTIGLLGLVLLVSSGPAYSETAKLAAAQTAAPVKKVDYPEKGKAISYIVAQAPGASPDLSVRALTPGLQRILGVPFQVVNKPGAGQQVGLTALFKSKPDGYTIGHTNLPTSITIYLDPSRKSAYGRKDIQPVVMYNTEPNVLLVGADSPYKSVKDLIDGAKANPGQISVGAVGIKSLPHLGFLKLQKLAGVKFRFVQYDDSPRAMTALLGGHVDVTALSASSVLSLVQGGSLRALAIMDTSESIAYPGVKTLEAQGYPVSIPIGNSVSAPAGIPKEYVNILADAFKKVVESPEVKSKFDQMGRTPRWMGPAEFEAYWDKLEAEVRAMLELAEK